MSKDSKLEEVLTEPRPRRSALRMMGAAAAAAATLPSALAHAKKVGLPFKKLKKLHEVGGSFLTKLKGQKVLLVRDTEETVRAINPVCTHKECVVKFAKDKGTLYCKCHKSAYDVTNGKVLDGPAPKPLQVFPSKLAGDKVVVTLPDE